MRQLLSTHSLLRLFYLRQTPALCTSTTYEFHTLAFLRAPNNHTTPTTTTSHP